MENISFGNYFGVFNLSTTPYYRVWKTCYITMYGKTYHITMNGKHAILPCMENISFDNYFGVFNLSTTQYCVLTLSQTNPGFYVSVVQVL